uniref:GDSL esterase/lipase At4g16230-like n=1 Tax=Nicotiana sylvestris TaxID=4096 RepID=A0A1U7XBD0_NICSY|nr:PREDICTED: GDSL esterase/lipase At4g16230-like [Nicotiana sylvestris]
MKNFVMSLTKYYSNSHTTGVIHEFKWKRPIGCDNNMCCAQLVPTAYMFGDSLVDVGNNNHFDTVIKANFPYNGVDYLG